MIAFTIIIEEDPPEDERERILAEFEEIIGKRDHSLYESVMKGT